MDGEKPVGVIKIEAVQNGWYVIPNYYPMSDHTGKVLVFNKLDDMLTWIKELYSK
jgi:hypothetical protein